MTLTQALIIGIVQGLTEFLPVSSSGHIAILQALFKIQDPGITFAVAVHVATLLAVLVAFRRDIVEVIGGVITGLVDLATGTGSSRVWSDNPGFRTGILLIIATIPAGLAGFLLKDIIERLFSTLLVVGVMLLVTGALLWLSGAVTRTGVPLRKFRAAPAFVVGIFQAVAIAPGLSRSGTTIAAGRFAGLTRDGAARFSFLLSIPTILGAALIDVKDLLAATAGGLNSLPLLVGMAASAVVGYIAIAVVMRAIRAGRLGGFAWYCWAVGLAVIFWQLVAR